MNRDLFGFLLCKQIKVEGSKKNKKHSPLLRYSTDRWDFCGFFYVVIYRPVNRKDYPGPCRLPPDFPIFIMRFYS